MTIAQTRTVQPLIESQEIMFVAVSARIWDGLLRSKSQLTQALHRAWNQLVFRFALFFRIKLN